MLSYPLQELWPERIYTLPELSYSDTTNACYELLDANLASGRGPTPAIHFGDSVITYSQLADDVLHAQRRAAHKEQDAQRGSQAMRLLLVLTIVPVGIGADGIYDRATPDSVPSGNLGGQACQRQEGIHEIRVRFAPEPSVHPAHGSAKHKP